MLLSVKPKSALLCFSCKEAFSRDQYRKLIKITMGNELPAGSFLEIIINNPDCLTVDLKNIKS
jgi:hypothetical protein